MIRLWLILISGVVITSSFALTNNSLKTIQITNLEAHHVQVALGFSEEALDTLSFSMEKPARLILDFIIKILI